MEGNLARRRRRPAGDPQLAGRQRRHPAGSTSRGVKNNGLIATAHDAKVTLAWTDPNNATIAKWQYQMVSAKAGGLTATPGSGRATISWDNPNDSTITKWEILRMGSTLGWLTAPTTGQDTPVHRRLEPVQWH